MQLTVRMAWHGQAFSRRLWRHLDGNLKDAGQYYANAVINDITRMQGSYSPDKHSLPGDPPYRITGDLVRSLMKGIQWDAVRHAWSIGSDLAYARYLEQGTSIMQKRPYLLINLIDNRAGIVRIWVQPFN